MVVLVHPIICDGCHKRQEKSCNYKLRIYKKRTHCKDCGGNLDEYVDKEFCSPKCVTKFLKKYDGHKCKDHYVPQGSSSDKDLKEWLESKEIFKEKKPKLHIMMVCKLCDGWTTMEVSHGKRGLIKKILPKTRRN